MTTKKRTARSASTRSTPQVSTEILQRRVAELESLVEDLDGANAGMASQRDSARQQVAALEKHMAACEATIQSFNVKAAAAAKMAVTMRIEMARKEGYIDRVREMDDRAIATPVRNPMPGELLDDVREAMTQVDEVTFGRMVESMSEDTLQKVMGRTNDGSTEILR